MGTNGDIRFDSLIAELTPLQLRWLRHRIESKSDREASRRAEIDKDTPGRWKAEGVPLDDIVALARQDGVVLVKERMRRDVNEAYDIKRSGLRSRSEAVRQSAATEILDRVVGKATLQQSVDVTSGGERIEPAPSLQGLAEVLAILGIKPPD